MYRVMITLVAACVLLVIAGLRGWGGPERIESKLFGVHRIYTGPRAEVWAARFGPADTVFAAASVDSSLRLWHTDGHLLRTLTAASGLTSCAWSADGRRVAASAYDGSLYCWSWPEGVLLQRYPTHQGTAWTLCFSPDGMLLASAGEDGVIVLRDLATGAVRQRLRGHTRNVWDIAFDPSEHTLASGSFDSRVCLWDVATGKQPRCDSGHSEAVVALAFRGDGAVLASAGDDGTVQLRAAGSGGLLRTLHTAEHQQGVAFSADGHLLVTSGRDHNALGELTQNIFGMEAGKPGVSMRLWDPATGRLLQTFSVHRDDVNDVQFSRDGQWILSAGADKRVILWKRFR